VYQCVSLRVDVWQCARTYGVQRPGKTSGAYNRSLWRSAPVLSHYPGAGTARLTDVPDIPAGRFRPSPSCSRWAAGWPCSCLRPGRAAGSARTIPSRLLLRRWPSTRRCRWDGRPTQPRCGSGGVVPQGVPDVPGQGLDPAEPVNVPAVDW